MKKTRLTAEQIMDILREAEASGQKTEALETALEETAEPGAATGALSVAGAGVRVRNPARHANYSHSRAEAVSEGIATD